MKPICVTVLVDNTVYRAGVQAEHGIAYCIDTPDKRILFDTGQSTLFMENAEALGVDLSGVDTVVLSHGHYDHTGGLSAYMEEHPDVVVAAHTDAFEKKYSAGPDGSVRDIGIPLTKEKIGNLQIHDCTGQDEIAPGVFALCDIPRKEMFEDNTEGFFKDPDCSEPDTLKDDLSLVIESNEGLVILLGCAHAGLLNILDTVADVFPGRIIAAVMGGTHLISADREKLDLTLKTLCSHNVKSFRPGHCTGLKSAAFFLMQGFVPTEMLGVGASLTV